VSEPFRAFDAAITDKAKVAATAATAAGRLAKALHKGASDVDLHLLRAKAADAAKRAAEAATALEQLRLAVAGFAVESADAATDALATTQPSLHEDYADAFAAACAALEVPLLGAYPDYRVFPFDVRIRLADERAIIGKKSYWGLRPEALAQAVKRERTRVHGGVFAADKFGRSLKRAFEVLHKEQGETGASPQVPLTKVLALLQLGTFGRNSYTKDEFAFDIYRYRETDMEVEGGKVAFRDARGKETGAFEVPTSRGTVELFAGLSVVPK